MTMCRVQLELNLGHDFCTGSVDLYVHYLMVSQLVSLNCQPLALALIQSLEEDNGYGIDFCFVYGVFFSEKVTWMSYSRVSLKTGVLPSDLTLSQNIKIWIDQKKKQSFFLEEFCEFLKSNYYKRKTGLAC